MSIQVYSAHQQTRQQLDELDSLLQRMLALPLSAAEPALPASPSNNSDAFAPLPPTLPQMNVVPRPTANGEPVVYAWRMAPAPAYIEDEPPMAIALDDPAPAASVPYPYSKVFGQTLPAVDAFVAPAPTFATPWTTSQPASEEHPLSLFNFPFVAVNRLFDVLSYLLGPLGTWLRQPAGRNTLGWLGVVMIIGAVGWAAFDWYGLAWTR